MSRFKGYLLQEGRTKELSKDNAIELLKKKCKKSLNAALSDRARIFRGIPYDAYDYGYINPKVGKPRKSPYAYGNYYTLLLDNLPSWKRYPDRSRSVICTTSLQEAERRSDEPYIVFPYDGSKIAVASGEDIWYSFPHMMQHGNLNDLNMWLSFLSFDESELIFIKQLKSITPQNVEEKTGNIEDFIKYNIFSDPTGKMNDFVEMDKKITLFDYFDELMNPKKNGFELKKVGDSLPYNKEVWTDGECILVKWENFKDIYENL